MYSFPLGESEVILMKAEANYSCDEVHLNGALYLTEQRLVFVGYILTLDEKYMEEIFLADIKELKKEKTFYLLPNLVTVTTQSDKYMKFVVKKRNEWFQAISAQQKKSALQCELEVVAQADN